MGALAVLAAVLLKDLRAELRTREFVVSMGVFSLLTVVVFGLAFEPWMATPLAGADREGVSFAQVVAPGLLWVAFAFAGVLGLNRSFAQERESGAVHALMLAPADRGAIFLGKALANTLLILVVEIVTLPVLAVLFNVPVLPALWRLLPVGVLGALGLSAGGTIFAGVAAGTRLKDVMLPFLLLPVATPVLVAAIEATGVALRAEQLGYGGAMRLLVGFDIAFLTVAYLLFGFVLEE